jgi:hypothetical protein
MITFQVFFNIGVREQAVKMTRLSSHPFRLNEVRLWLSILDYNTANLWRRLALPVGISDSSLNSLQQMLLKRVRYLAVTVTLTAADIAVK